MVGNALAELIIDAVGFDFDHAFEFCDNLRNPYRSKERYTLFADIGEDKPGEPGVKKIRVSDVFRPRRKVLFHFDYGDDWCFLVTCTAVKESAAKRRFKGALHERHPAGAVSRLRRMTHRLLRMPLLRPDKKPH
jgi:hypothetical protein